MRVHATLVLWDTGERVLEKTLAGVAAQSNRIQMLWIWINEAGEHVPLKTVTRLAEGFGIPLRTDASTGNRGFAAPHNVLLARAFASGCDAALVLNPDVFLGRHCVQRLAEFAQPRHAPMLLGPVLELSNPESLSGEGTLDTTGIVWTSTGRHLNRDHGRPLASRPTAPERVRGLSGACMFVTKSAYDRITNASGEFFDENFFAYREDAELGLRAELLGVEQWILPEASALHVRRLRGTSRDVGAHINALGVRNRFLIAFKYGRRRPGICLAALARDAVVVAGVLLRERDSTKALKDAWHMRQTMRQKGSVLMHQRSAR